jgi:hypothetical protein
MPLRDRRLLLAAALATSGLVVLAALAGHPELLAYAAPLFLLAVPLIAGRYVGEERLERLRCRFTARRRRVPVAELDHGRPFPLLLPRGGRLIARGLAERAPPAPAAV